MTIKLGKREVGPLLSTHKTCHQGVELWKRYLNYICKSQNALSSLNNWVRDSQEVPLISRDPASFRSGSFTRKFMENIYCVFITLKTSFFFSSFVTYPFWKDSLFLEFQSDLHKAGGSWQRFKGTDGVGFCSSDHSRGNQNSFLMPFLIFPKYFSFDR